MCGIPFVPSVRRLLHCGFDVCVKPRDTDYTCSPHSSPQSLRLDVVAAAVLGGVDNIWIKPGSKVLYIGAAAGTSVSHVSDIVGPTGAVYAVEFSHRPGRDLINMAKSRTNVIPIIEDARHPLKYRMLVGMVDCVFADVAQPDQARIVALNSHYFLEKWRTFCHCHQGKLY